MPVNVDCHLDAGVPELLLHISQWFAILNEQGSEGMPEIMKSDPPESCLFQAPDENPVLEVLHISGISFLIRKHPLRNFILSPCEPLRLVHSAKSVERLQEFVRKIDSALLAGLGRIHLTVDDVSPNHQELAVKVDVPPLKPS